MLAGGDEESPMTDERVHRAVSADGTRIAGRVQGQGPPLVLVHGALPDGDTAWQAMIPLLAGRFTCFLPSLRGRGLSEDGPDHSPPRLQEDVQAFVESVGEPVYLAGWSAGVVWSLAAAANSDAVAAFVAYEPTIIPLLRPADGARRDAMYRQLAEAAAEGRMADAARAFHEFVGTANELAALDADYFDRCAPCVPALLRSGRDAATYRGPMATDPEALAKVTVPVVLLRGRQTRLGTFYADTERHLAEHVADARVRPPLPGLGHMGPLLDPEPIAAELTALVRSGPETRSTQPVRPGEGVPGSHDGRS
jgi:pimeloyl-ACP methyl ester carboxylesterase